MDKMSYICIYEYACKEYNLESNIPWTSLDGFIPWTHSERVENRKIKIFIDWKPKNKPKRNSGAEKYNNWNKKFTRGIQRQISAADRTMEIPSLRKRKEKKKTEEGKNRA